MHHPGTFETKKMLNEICRPAVLAVTEELQKRAVQVDVTEVPLEEDAELYHLDITIHLEEEQNFIYQIWPVRYIAPNFSERGKRGKQFLHHKKPSGSPCGAWGLLFRCAQHEVGQVYGYNP